MSGVTKPDVTPPPSSHEGYRSSPACATCPKHGSTMPRVQLYRATSLPKLCNQGGSVNTQGRSLTRLSMPFEI